MPSTVPPHYQHHGDFQYRPTGNPSQPQVLPPKEDSSKSFGSKAAEWMAKGALEGTGKGLGTGLVGVMFDKIKDDTDGTLALLSGASASSLELITGTVSAVAGISE